MVSNALIAGLIHRDDDLRLAETFKIYEMIAEDEDMDPIDTLSYKVDENTKFSDLCNFIASNKIDALFFPLTIPNCLALKIPDFVKSNKIPIKIILTTDGGSEATHKSSLFDKITSPRDWDIGRIAEVAIRNLSIEEISHEINYLLKKEECFAKRIVGDHHHSYITTETWDLEYYNKSKSDDSIKMPRTVINLAMQPGTEEDRRIFSAYCSADANQRSLIKRRILQEEAESIDVTSARPVVVLIHGIRDYGLWQQEIRDTLEAEGFHVESTNYGRFNLIEFLLPFNFFRKRAAAEMLIWLNAVFYRYPGSSVSIIAHSFGTYVISQIIKDNFNIKIDRIIFCGSVVKYNFPFQNFSSRFKGDILNEVGTRDIWPAMAESLTTGYGSAGTFGFRRPFVYDRWHNGAGHGFFLTKEFCQKFWLPYLKDGKVVADSPSPESPPIFASFISIVKIKFLLLLISFGLALYLIKFQPQNYFSRILSSVYNEAKNVYTSFECSGLPGETAWIYAGGFDRRTGLFKNEPVYMREGGLPFEIVKPGEWVRLTTQRKTMILDYDKNGTARAMDSPFTMNSNIRYTCKTIDPGTRLYIADVKINGPSAEDSHVWFRVRTSVPGSHLRKFYYAKPSKLVSEDSSAAYVTDSLARNRNSSHLRG